MITAWLNVLINNYRRACHKSKYDVSLNPVNTFEERVVSLAVSRKLEIRSYVLRSKRKKELHIAVLNTEPIIVVNINLSIDELDTIVLLKGKQLPSSFYDERRKMSRWLNCDRIAEAIVTGHDKTNNYDEYS